jgi:hypothetical protein
VGLICLMAESPAPCGWQIALMHRRLISTAPVAQTEETRPGGYPVVLRSSHSAFAINGVITQAISSFGFVHER